MGIYLNTPKTEKFSEDGGNDHLRYGLSSMQGWRATMEYAHAAYLDLDAFTSSFGVYDGHGSKVVAKFCAKYLHQQVLKSDAYAAEDIATPDCLILAISPANQDLATSDVIKWGEDMHDDT